MTDPNHRDPEYVLGAVLAAVEDLAPSERLRVLAQATMSTRDAEYREALADEYGAERDAHADETDAAWNLMQGEYDAVVAWARLFPNADQIPCLMIPWGDNLDSEGADVWTISGIMVDCDADPNGAPSIRVGIYHNTVEEAEHMHYARSSAEAIALVDAITEAWPEGTNWAAWAAHYAQEIHEVQP